MKNNYSRLKWVALIIVGGILLFLAKSATAANLRSPLLLQQEVSGKVIDHNGIPISGVTVTLKGSSRGTLTNLDGNYSITASENAILVFSFIGYKTQEEQVINQAVINVQLEVDIASLGEVQINAGYYNTTRRESTGNISRVTAEEIELQPVVSPILALQGRMAGVEIISGGVNPGTASTIRIRGTNSLRKEGNFPLYIIDGVPINSTPIESYSNLIFGGIDPLNTLNVSNIESIEVLKDADATAIYGSRGANGVILITTKKGIAGKTEVQARFYTGVSTVPNRVDLLNTEDYLQIRKRAFENDGVEPTENNAYDLLVWDQNRYTDWQEVFFGGTSQVTNLNLNASGGNENTTFRLSGSYHTQGTVFLGDYDYKKITGGAQLNHTSNNNRLNLDLSLNYGVDINNLVGYLNLSADAFRLPPNAPSLFNEDSTINWQDWEKVGLNNPLSGFYNTSLTEGHNLNSNMVVSYKLFNGFRVKSNFGYTTFNSDELVKRPLRSFSPSTRSYINNRSNSLVIQRNSWIMEPQLNYRRKIGKGNLDFIVGTTFQKSGTSVISLQGEGYVSESLIGNLNAADNIISPINESTDYRYNAIFSRLGLNWDKKYYLNLTGRRDGSSRFGPGKQFANFGALGGAWIFSEENFINKLLPFLSYGKFRGSYGTTGNDQIGDYGYFDAYKSTFGPGGLYPNQLSNPDYSWEVNKKLEAAIELGFLKDRLNLGLSWYRNRSSNQLVGFSLPAITGFTSIQANLPATVENTGIEVELSVYAIQSGNFRWQSSLNVSIPKNRLVNYPGIEESSYANTYRVGEPLNISLLFEYDGIDPETGLYRFRDINEDGTLDYIDRNIAWNHGREFFGGINNSLSLKNFSLQFLWQFVKQEGMFALFRAGALENQRADVIQALGTNSSFQRISRSTDASRTYTNVLNSTNPITDASYLRLKTLSLEYSLPQIWLQNIGLQSGKLFLNGQNLWTITAYEGIDPELPDGGTSFGALRTITGGFQLNF
jgi:TonB-linked SusC/RagA family outer membrane protein